jgi:hypothetical protein
MLERLMWRLMLAAPLAAFVIDPGMAQPVYAPNGSGSVRPEAAGSGLNIPAFMNPSAAGSPPAYAPSPTTPVQPGQFAPTPPATPPALGTLPIPPAVLERRRPPPTP